MCEHGPGTLAEVSTFDSQGLEKVCTVCGEVQPTEVEEAVKLSGCMDLEEFKNVTYGPATPVQLESFLVPTLSRIKCRDRFLDTKIHAKLRVYTWLLRVCEQNGIPKVYAIEATAMLLKSGKGLYSKYLPIQCLIKAIGSEPRLANRIEELTEIAFPVQAKATAQ